MINIFLGYDEREPIAYHVLSHSILRRASVPIAITPIRGNLLSREKDSNQSTDHTYARFLTPWLSDSLISIYLDSSMLCRCDLAELVEIAKQRPTHDVHVVQHQYKPKYTKKGFNQTQTDYERKNWASMMVFNGSRMPIRRLTPYYINTAKSLHLLQFDWAQDIGALPTDWNHLVGEYPENPYAKIVNFTLGGPWFANHKNCEFAEEWFEEFERMNHAGHHAFDHLALH